MTHSFPTRLSSDLISRRKFEHPFRFKYVPVSKDSDEKKACLVVKSGHVMDHMGGSMHLRDWYNALPVKSARVFKQQCMSAGLVLDDDVTLNTLDDRRAFHCLALSIEAMEATGVFFSAPTAPEIGSAPCQGRGWPEG